MKKNNVFRRALSAVMDCDYTPFTAATCNIFLLFVIYTILRVEYFLENLEFFRPSIADGSILMLLFAGPVFDTPGIMYTNALYVLLMLIPFHLKERAGYYRVCKWLYMVVNSIAIMINVADSVYFSYTLRRSTTEVFGEFSGEGNLSKIFFTEVGNHWYLLIFAVAVIYGMRRLYVNPKATRTSGSLVAYYILGILTLLIGAITVISGIRGGLLNHWYNYVLAIPAIYIGLRLIFIIPESKTKRKAIGIAFLTAGLLLLLTAPIGGLTHRDIRPIALSNANAYTSRPTETALVLNTPFTLIRTIKSTVFSNPHYYDDKELLEEIYTPVHHATDSIKTNKKNVVIIIIESYGREYIGGLSKEMIGEEYKGYTPFTDSLLNHSLSFRYSFCNGRKSIDGIPSVLASIPCFVKPFVLTPQALNRIEGLPAHLSHIGYRTAFFHGARTGSMGFDGIARSIGFDKYYGREDYEADSRFGGKKDFDGYWAIWDEPFMQFYATKMSEMKQPFMTAIFTASSHHPFHIPEKYRSQYPEEGLPIHKCIRYTDNSLRAFFRTASRQKWFDNTIFVITSDHTNMSDHAEYKTDLGGFHSPIIIYDPTGSIAPGHADAIAQQIDIMPTILDYIGYPHPYVAFGKNLLKENIENGWAVNYLNGVYQYVKNGYVLQFDGNKSTGLYLLTDKLMQHNLVDSHPGEREAMEKEVKAIIQSYMDRMASDSLTVK